MKEKSESRAELLATPLARRIQARMRRFPGYAHGRVASAVAARITRRLVSRHPLAIALQRRRPRAFTPAETLGAGGEIVPRVLPTRPATPTEPVSGTAASGPRAIAFAHSARPVAAIQPSPERERTAMQSAATEPASHGITHVLGNRLLQRHMSGPSARAFRQRVIAREAGTRPAAIPTAEASPAPDAPEQTVAPRERESPAPAVIQPLATNADAREANIRTPVEVVVSPKSGARPAADLGATIMRRLHHGPGRPLSSHPAGRPEQRPVTAPGTIAGKRAHVAGSRLDKAVDQVMSAPAGDGRTGSVREDHGAHEQPDEAGVLSSGMRASRLTSSPSVSASRVQTAPAPSAGIDSRRAAASGDDRPARTKIDYGDGPAGHVFRIGSAPSSADIATGNPTSPAEAVAFPEVPDPASTRATETVTRPVIAPTQRTLAADLPGEHDALARTRPAGADQPGRAEAVAFPEVPEPASTRATETVARPVITPIQRTLAGDLPGDQGAVAYARPAPVSESFLSLSAPRHFVSPITRQDTAQLQPGPITVAPPHAGGHGASPPEARENPMVDEPEATAGVHSEPGEPVIDLDRLTNEVYERLISRLAGEREQRGL